MAKYEIIYEKYGDVFNKGFDDKDEALKRAKLEWESLSDYDKKKCTTFYVLESVNPDEDAEDHLDGNTVIQYK